MLTTLNRVSEAADNPAYGRMATRTESHEAPNCKWCNGEGRVTKDRAVSRRSYCGG